MAHFVNPAQNCSEHTPTKGCYEHVRFTIGGDRVKYPGEVITKTADLTTVKLHLNSVVSMLHEKFLCININNFYLNINLNDQNLPA